MGHNLRIRPGGAWGLLTSVSPAEFETFDQRQFEAINGDQGGTWAPAAVIQIGGAGIRLDTWLVGNWVAVGNPQFTGVATFNTAPIFNPPPTFNGGLHVHGGTALFDAGVPVSAAGSAAAFQSVTVTDSTGYRYSATETFATKIPLIPALADGWSSDANGLFIQDTVTLTRYLLLPILIPAGATITAVHVWVDGNGGIASHALIPGPAELPTIELVRRTWPDVAPAVVATASDLSADLAHYEALHTIDLNALTESVSSRSNYWLRVRGEQGANSVPGALALYWAEVVWTHSRQCQAWS